MSGRYIDADAYRAKWADIFDSAYGDSCCEMFKKSIDAQPTADVVEVVRCKDCEEWQDDWIPSCGDNRSHYCATMDSVMKPTDFCSYGERREDAN